MGVAGKKVLITGASHGIGAAAATAFAQAGCDVGINYHRNREGAEATRSAVRALGREAELYEADVSDPDACETMVNAFLDRFGRIDVLINNAGGALRIPEGGFIDMPVSYWNNQVDLNLNAAAYTSRIAIRDMIARKNRGKIINVGSIHGIVTWVKRKMLPYSPAKAGLAMFTKALGVEVARYGINVNLIAPGFIQTSLSARFGLKVTFSRPDKSLYCSIVCDLAKQRGIEMPEEELIRRAEAHALRNGGRSPRTARQFIDYLAYSERK